jgi:hypothetical protein
VFAQALFARQTSRPGDSLFLRLLRFLRLKSLAAAKGRAMSFMVEKQLRANLEHLRGLSGSVRDKIQFAGTANNLCKKQLSVSGC